DEVHGRLSPIAADRRKRELAAPRVMSVPQSHVVWIRVRAVESRPEISSRITTRTLHQRAGWDHSCWKGSDFGLERRNRCPSNTNDEGLCRSSACRHRQPLPSARPPVQLAGLVTTLATYNAR